MNGPLDAIRILDFTRFQQGPYATVLLSDLGAAVIKVEARGDGDMGRSLGRQPDGWSSYFEAHNRNKRSITVDVRKPEGRDIIYKLIPSIDVVTDNFRPGVMPRLGLKLRHPQPDQPRHHHRHRFRLRRPRPRCQPPLLRFHWPGHGRHHVAPGRRSRPAPAACGSPASPTKLAPSSLPSGSWRR